MQTKIAATLSTTVVSVAAIVATVMIVLAALDAGKNGAILMTGFTVIGVAIGTAAGYNTKKIMEIKNKLTKAVGAFKEPENEPSRNDK